MKKCTNCFYEDPDDALFCSHCGKPFSIQSPNKNKIDHQSNLDEKKENSRNTNRGCWISFGIIALIVSAIALSISISNNVSTNYKSPAFTATSRPVNVYLTKTATTVVIIRPTATPYIASQSWRIKDYPGAVLEASDSYTNSNYTKSVEMFARNHAISPPYYWNWYQLPQNTRFADIEDYFKPLATEMRFRIGEDEQWATTTGDDIFLLSFLQGYGKKASYIYMEFWPYTTSYDAQLLIFYVNPQ
jgi:hypothetical protein